MKFLPAINLWDNATQQAVISGQIKLQVGQWVRCGSDKLSRFVCVSPGGSVWVVHPGGEKGTITRSHFTDMVNTWTGKKQKKAAGV